MILREWRGRVPHEKVDGYIKVLEKTGLREYAATPGNRGVWLLLNRDGEAAEFVTLTLWESRDAIRAFAGDDIGKAVYYPEDDEYLLEKPERLRHYEVLKGA
jgi:heme-degrading monooxygenase HmoA